MLMKNLVLLAIIATAISLNCDQSQKHFSPEEKAAINSAINWLQLMDEGLFRQSWQIASQSFKEDVTEKRWAIGMEYMRAPYGGVVSRRVISTGPGGPDYKQIVALFQTTFEDQNTVNEFVTLQLVDSVWQVSTYYLDR